MPGIVVFQRRWSVASDDLIVPGLLLFIVHFIWLLILSAIVALLQFGKHEEKCIRLFRALVIGYISIYVSSIILEALICYVSMRGSILDQKPRSSMPYLIHLRTAVLLMELVWHSVTILWYLRYYSDCKITTAIRQSFLTMIICNCCVIMLILATVWCTYDAAGRSWVKMKKYQHSMRDSETKFRYKRSGSTRNWRQRKVIRAYEDSWQQRCRFLCCCARPSDRNSNNNFADVARLLSDFFRDLDVVPSDVIAGLVLLRKFQKIERDTLLAQRYRNVSEFLSGVPITPRTKFLALDDDRTGTGSDVEIVRATLRYARFAMGAYGWPIYVMGTHFGVCKICPYFSTTCRILPAQPISIIEDNCCGCNFAVLQKLITDLGDVDVTYATYHVDVAQTPFYIALDYKYEKVVISVRGTLSVKDILTDLNAEGEQIPLRPPREDWLGHKGMVEAAKYLCEKLLQEQLIEAALNHAPERNSHNFTLCLVGHSLGAGTASILGILLRQYYPNLECYCYSPPGGLLSEPAVEYSKSFTVSVVVGKDVVPRIGLYQMEALRADIINAIKQSVDPKWKTIACSTVCCGCIQPTSAIKMSTGDSYIVNDYIRIKKNTRHKSLHPSDCSISLTLHSPLYPPGRILHLVRRHREPKEHPAVSKNVYRALWADNKDFDEVLISPVMIQDHMPETLLDALNKILASSHPSNEIRENNTNARSAQEANSSLRPYVIETSFTSQPKTPPDICWTVHRATKPSNTESITNSTKFKPKVDLIHDDWFGNAPLASPEITTMSSCPTSRSDSESLSILHTPTIMKRTPRIVGDLSTCADDIYNVRNFESSKTFTIPRSLAVLPNCSSTSDKSLAASNCSNLCSI